MKASTPLLPLYLALEFAHYLFDCLTSSTFEKKEARPNLDTHRDESSSNEDTDDDEDEKGENAEKWIIE